MHANVGTLLLSGGGSSSGTLSASSGATLQLGGNFAVNGGSITGAGVTSFVGTGTWTDGDMTGTGTTNVAAGATLAVSGNGPKRLSKAMPPRPVAGSRISASSRSSYWAMEPVSAARSLSSTTRAMSATSAARRRSTFPSTTMAQSRYRRAISSLAAAAPCHRRASCRAAWARGSILTPITRSPTAPRLLGGGTFMQTDGTLTINGRLQASTFDWHGVDWNSATAGVTTTIASGTTLNLISGGYKDFNRRSPSRRRTRSRS